MAGAKPGVHIVQLKPVTVPQALQDGEKFIKWEEDSAVGIPVTLKVDPYGYYLYWTNQNKESECLDIATIRDTRTGKGARVPKDPKLRTFVTMGTADTLEEKTLTVVSGPDFVNLNFINFCCMSKETAKFWADELVSMAYNSLQINGSLESFLRKVYTRLTIMTDKQGRIPIKNIIKVFAQNKEDRKRVEKALEAAGFSIGKPLGNLNLPKPVEKLSKASSLIMLLRTRCNVNLAVEAQNDTLNPAKFSFEDFFNFYKALTVRPEVEKAFDELCGYNKKKLMTAEQFMEFINKEQRDPRLNEILYPYTNPDRARELIAMYEPHSSNVQKGVLSLDGFMRYLLSDECAIVSLDKYDLSDDMDHPLNHYFINSSHNTYLTGHQLTGKSSVEIYRQALLAGCRCVELDFWNGPENPVIVHGYTLVQPISAKDVIEAIAESAFKTSDCPVVLSFENHCNDKQQAKIAQYCKEYFGSMLLDMPLDSYPLQPGVALPPPSALKRRIIIKNKKKHHHRKQKPQKKLSKPLPVENGTSPPPLTKEDSKDSMENEDAANTPIDDEDSLSSDDDEDSVEPEDPKSVNKPEITDKGTAGKESEAGEEISALVNYVQPVRFSSFETSKNRNKAYEMSSFDEKQAMTLLKERPVQFVNYNKHQLARVYPKGTRVDSSNFMPQMFWNAGCQLVALNYQTLDLPMQLNLGIFELNNHCGFLLKPEFMRVQHRNFDPFAESTVDGIIANTVSVKVISGQFLSDKRIGTYVEVEMYGLPTDTVRKKFRTKTVIQNGINPFYDEEPFEFKKVVLPHLACLRIVCYEESGKMIGHRVLPVVGLRPGYRHVILRNEAGQPLNCATLFLLVRVKDYIPDGFADLAEALANPIKHHSEKEKRAQQLSVLQDDQDEEASESSEHQNLKLNRLPSHKVKDVTSNASVGLAQSSPVVPGGVAPVHKADSMDDPSCRSAVGAPAAPSQQTGLPSIPEPAPAAGGSPGARPPVRTVNSGTKYIDVIRSSIQPEPIEKFWDQKPIREKKSDLDKRIESLRKKHEKDRKGSRKESKSKPPMALVKRLSTKKLNPLKSTEPKEPAAANGSCEQIIEQLSVEKDALLKGYDELYQLLEKTIKTSQARQLSLLKGMEKKENDDIMTEIGNQRKEECRKLAKLTKDKHEYDRMKRETSKRLVDQGVDERERVARTYTKERLSLESKHDEILKQLQVEKQQAFKKIESECHDQMEKLTKENAHAEDMRSHSTIPHSTHV